MQRIAIETAEDRAKLQSYFFIRESESIDFLNRVEAIAPQAGVTLETEGLKQVEGKEDGYVWIESQFSFSGSRDDVQRFVRILETLPYQLRLTNLEMSAQSSSLWEALVTIKVRVLDYDSQ